MAISYRKATLNDIQDITDMVTQAIADMERQGIYQWDNLYPDASDFISDVNEDTLYVGYNDQQLAVVFAINHDYDEQYSNGQWHYPDRSYLIIHRLCVNTAMRHQGIGKQTIAYIESLVKQQGVQAIRLDAFKQNPAAIAMYESLGYTTVGYAQLRKGTFCLMEKYL